MLTSSHSAALPEIEALLLDPRYYQDPYRAYALLRERAPVYWSPGLGQWLISGYEQVMAALHAPDLFSNFGWERSYVRRLPEEARAQLVSLELQYSTPTIVFSDPPQHTRLRKLVSRTFTPRAIEPLRAWLEDVSRELVRGPVRGGVLDVMRDLAFPLPLRAIAQLFGGRAEDTALYLELSQKRLAFFGAQTPDPALALQLDATLTEFRRRLAELFVALRRDPDGGFLSTLLSRDESGDALSEEELLALCLVLLTAGHETTTGAIGSTVLGLLRNPEQWALVHDDPSLVSKAFEEGLRWQGSAQRIRRIVREDREFFGGELRAGDEAVLVLGAANRDPRVFPDPDRFDVLREGPGHVGLGHGIHYCVGAGLARLEAEIALRTLLELAPTMRLRPGWEPEWFPSINQRSLVALPVETG